MCVALTLLQHGEVHAIEEYNLTKVQSQMCFLTAVSSNHYYNVLKYISSTQKIYPCSKVYVYDLGNQSVNVYARACNISSLDVRWCVVIIFRIKRSTSCIFELPPLCPWHVDAEYNEVLFPQPGVQV
jgi:hypothetical protein